MAVGNGAVRGGESGELELNSLASPSGGSHRQDPGAESGELELNSLASPSGGSHRQVPGAESGVPESNSLLNPSGGSHHQDLGAQSGVPELISRPNPSGGSPPQDPQSVIVVVPENFPHEEIQNVLWIEDSTEHRAALKEWDRKESYLSSKVDRKEKRSADLTNHIFNIVGFFSVFQGVVLTAVSQLKSSAKPLCGMVWVPALLSIVAAVVTIIGVLIKFSTLLELETSIHNEKIPQTAVAARATKLRAKGRKFNFSEHAVEGKGRKSSSWISISRISVIVSLVFFTGLFILSYVVILCNSLAVHKWNKHLLST